VFGWSISGNNSYNVRNTELSVIWDTNGKAINMAFMAQILGQHTLQVERENTYWEDHGYGLLGAKAGAAQTPS
jgi:hypothetical protein